MRDLSGPGNLYFSPILRHDISSSCDMMASSSDTGIKQRHELGAVEMQDQEAEETQNPWSGTRAKDTVSQLLS